MSYIITTYNKYDSWDRTHAQYIFEINDTQYAIMEVISFSNQPQLPIRMDRDTDPKTYRLYPTYEEALQFVKYLKHLNY